MATDGKASFTYVVTEQAKAQMKLLVNAEYELGKKADPASLEAKIDWAAGHTPVVVDFSKKSSAAIVVKGNLLINFLNPVLWSQAKITVGLRLIHDDTNNVYSIIWGGGAPATDPMFSTPVKWYKAKPVAFAGAHQVMHISFVYGEWLDPLTKQTSVYYFGDWDANPAQGKKENWKTVGWTGGSGFTMQQIEQQMKAMQKQAMAAAHQQEQIKKQVDKLHAMAAEWQAEHSSIAFMEKAYKVYCQDCFKADKQALSPSEWQKQYLAELNALTPQLIADQVAKLEALDKQQGKSYLYPSEATKKVKTPKIVDISAEELQAQLEKSLNQSKATIAEELAYQQEQITKVQTNTAKMAEQAEKAAKVAKLAVEIEKAQAAKQKAEPKPEPTVKAYQVKSIDEKKKIVGEVTDKQAQAEANLALAGLKKPEPKPEVVEEIMQAVCDEEEPSHAGEIKQAVKDMFKVEVQLRPVGNNFKILFHAKVPTHVDPEKLPVVSLSRHHGSCWYRLDKLQEHDYHVSTFSPADVKPYTLRVLKEIRDKMVAAKLLTDWEIQDMDALEFDCIGKKV